MAACSLASETKDRMIIFLTGISCVGKTTVGTKLAVLLGCSFFDLDDEIESFFSTPIERLQEKFLTMYSFREEASKALKDIISRESAQNSVIALPPSGLMGHYWRIVKKSNGTIIVLTDDAINILNRITFYDKDSNPININLSEKDIIFHLKDINKDITYFNRTYKKADISINISGLNSDQASIKVKEILDRHLQIRETPQ